MAAAEHLESCGGEPSQRWSGGNQNRQATHEIFLREPTLCHASRSGPLDAFMLSVRSFTGVRYAVSVACMRRFLGESSS